jgi:hypothetical protein
MREHRSLFDVDEDKCSRRQWLCPITGSLSWKEETVNLYEDYKNLFGGEPEEALGIALLSSADGTKSVAEADDDDFVLLPPEK